MKKIFTVLALSAGNLFAQSPFVHFPALSPDATQIAFSYQGDIWKMPAQGGKAIRLSVHEGFESMPKWSPDGKQIAFEGERFGNLDIFVMDSEKGNPKRLTFRSTNDKIGSWDKNKIWFTSYREHRQVERETEIFSISTAQATEERSLDAFGTMPTVSPDGRFLAFVRGYSPLDRPAYIGSANLDIWLFDQNTKKYSQVTNFEGNDISPDWVGKTLYFLRAVKGVYNLHKTDISENGTAQNTVQLTTFEEDGIRNFDVSADGKVVVFERQDAIFSCSPDGKNIQKINIELVEDQRFDESEIKNFSKADEYSISPNEKLIAFAVRGEVFIKENNKEKSRSVALDASAFRERDIAFLNDSSLVYASDRNGNYDLFMVKSSDSKQSNLFKTLKTKVTQLTDNQEDERNFVFSPDGKKIAFVRGRGKLVVADIGEKISNEKILLDGWDTPEGIVWSPDGAYLAYSLSDLYFNQEIYIQNSNGNEKAVNISLHPRYDYSPKWSEDGSKLAFLSQRNNADADIWFVWLKKSDFEKTKQDWEEKEAEKEAKKDDKKKKRGKVQIDFDNIHDRLVQVTSLPAGESNLLIAPNGETFYFVSNQNGRGEYKADKDLYSVKWDGSSLKALTTGGQNPNSLTILDGKNIYGLKNGTIVRYDAKDGKAENRPLNAQFRIDYKAERLQVFTEAWRTLDNGFYDPNFHGQNWKKVGEKYKKWATQTASEYDYARITNEMLGLLNASHMGFRHADRAETQTETTALLGIEIQNHEKGVQITRIVKGSPADLQESKLAVGEIITKINGSPIGKTNFYSFFNKLADQQILLEVLDTKNISKEIVIRPTNSISDLLYEEWINDRKKLVEKYSNGRLGYIHIKGMDWESFERFEREIMASCNGKEGILIDVRNNGGGWTTDHLLNILNVRQHSYTVPRGAAKELSKESKNFEKYYPYSERLPFPVINVPTIALCNEFSYSNAEIFSHAYKYLKYGKLVGKTTFGAVISTGGNSLMDGSFVRLPFRGWYGKADGKDMEDIGAVPDISLENTPDHKAKNEDQQLQKAVEILLEDIKK